MPKVNLKDVLKDTMQTASIEYQGKKYDFGILPVNDEYMMAQIEIGEKIAKRLGIDDKRIKELSKIRLERYIEMQKIRKKIEKESGKKYEDMTDKDFEKYFSEIKKTVSKDIQEQKYYELMDQESTDIILKFLIVDKANPEELFFEGDVTKAPKDFKNAIVDKALPIIKGQEVFGDLEAKK